MAAECRRAALAGWRLELEVVSDVICPWCFMGKRRLERALRELERESGVQALVRWRPWMLAPKLPKTGLPKADMYRRKFRDDERRLTAMMRNVQEAGAEDGITFTFEGTVGNTLDAHRLVWMVRERPLLQNRLMEELFRAYHERGESPGEAAVLLQCAAAAGFDQDDLAAARCLLAGDAGEAEVREEQRAAPERWDMLGGVPHIFVRVTRSTGDVSGPQPPQLGFSVPGAQDVSTFLRVFNRALDRACALQEEASRSPSASAVAKL